MGIFIKQARLLPSFRVPSIPTTINVNMFFDRAAVKNALTAMEYKALSKAGMVVKDAAKRSIKKMGMAKPKLVEQKANPGMRLSDILARTTNNRRRAVIIERIRQIKFRPPSAPGSPPHTHVPFGHMLGFRRNLYNAYDKGSHSAVVGPSKKGSEWTIPMLHEFGGSKGLKEFVLVPKYPRYTKPIIKWVGIRDDPGQGWVATGQTKSAKYPARPYMAPALAKCRPKLAKLFEGQFSAGIVRGAGGP